MWILYTARSLVGKGPRPKDLDGRKESQENGNEDGGIVLEGDVGSIASSPKGSP